MTKLQDKDLLYMLKSQQHQSGRDLTTGLGVSNATLSRRLRLLGPDLLRRGSTKNARYSLQRPLRGRMEKLPVYSIDQNGVGNVVGSLVLTEPRGSLFESSGEFPWPVEGPLQMQGWWDGLPYPMYDMRPKGFLGRNFAHRYARTLEVSTNPEQWGDDDIIYVLSREGHDMPGDWIVGNQAYKRFLEQQTNEERFIGDDDIDGRYPELARDALAEGYGGSSAAGEFAKFIAPRMIDGRPRHVIVKFSGGDDSAAVRRWSDLLACEHIALLTLEDNLKLPVPASRIREASGRRFLEVVRFDRHGTRGRSPVCTLESLNGALIGRTEATWPESARELAGRGFLPQIEAERVRLLWWFGRLIGNTDMHNGNLAFLPGLRLAPAYDMLPMLFAPQRGGEIPERELRLEPPLPEDRDGWNAAAQAAAVFWRRCADDLRITPDFRTLCARHAVMLERR